MNAYPLPGKLLPCAGLRLRPLALGAVALSLCPGPAFAQGASPAQLPAVEVRGRAAPRTYHAEEAAAAKSQLPLRELPQSVRVITQESISDLGATGLDDVLDYVGGVSRQNNFGGLWDNVAIRGLPGHDNTGLAMLFNGFAANRGYAAPRDLVNVESIEFLKGPAAALYGSSEPGGTLNLVSKRPRWKAAHVVEAQAGNLGFRRATVDSTGPVGPAFAYRLSAAVEDRDGFRDHVDARRRLLAPAFTWKLGRDTVLDYRGEFIHHATPMDRGVVAVNRRLGAIPRSRFLGEPGDGDITLTNQRHQLTLAHEWSTGWHSRFGLSYLDTSLRGLTTQASGVLRADGMLSRQAYFRDYDSEDLAAQAELQGKIRTGDLEHELLLGIESFRFRMNSLALSANPTAGAPYAIDIHDPAYGQPRPALGVTIDTLERQRNTALYLQDAIKLTPRLRLVAGARLDHYRQSLDNRRTGVTTRQQPSATSPRVGLSWLPTPQWTLYANAGRSFRPNTGTDAGGNGFSPEKGRALELGGKWENTERTLGATFALFDIRKRHVLTSDPAHPGYSTAAGEVRSRGLEVDVGGQLSRHWRLNASLLLNEVEVTRDHRLQVGGRLRNVPKLTASALALYEDVLANGQGWGLGAGFTHVGRRLGESYTEAEARAGTPAFDLPAYTTAKLVGHWQVTPATRVSLDVDNLFDRSFYTSSYSRLWVAPGTPRAITLGLRSRF